MDSVLFGTRQSGKTYTIMTEIHDLILAGERAGILVVFPNMSYVHWWINEWRRRFPSIPPPTYTSIESMDRVRGRRLRDVYVEDIDGVADGIYHEKLNYLSVVLEPDGSITYTYSPLPDAAWRTTPDDWTEEAA